MIGSRVALLILVLLIGLPDPAPAQEAGAWEPWAIDYDAQATAAQLRFKGCQLDKRSLPAIEELASYLKPRAGLALKVYVRVRRPRDPARAQVRAQQLAQRIVYALENCWLAEGRAVAYGLGNQPGPEVELVIWDRGTAMLEASERERVERARAEAERVHAEADRARAEAERAAEPQRPSWPCDALRRAIEAAPSDFAPITHQGSDEPTVSLPGASSCSLSGSRGFDWKYLCMFGESVGREEGEERFLRLREQVSACLVGDWIVSDRSSSVDLRMSWAAGQVGPSTVGVVVSLMDELYPGGGYALRTWVQRLE